MLICIIISSEHDQYGERKNTSLERNYKHIASEFQKTSELTAVGCVGNSTYINKDEALSRVLSRAWIFERHNDTCSLTEINNILNFGRYLPRYIIVGYSDEVLRGFVYFEKQVGLKQLFANFPVKCKWQKGCYKITSSIDAIKRMPAYKHKGIQPLDRYQVRPKSSNRSEPTSNRVSGNILTERTASCQKAPIIHISPTNYVQPIMVASQPSSKTAIQKCAISSETKLHHTSFRDVRVHSLLKNFDKLPQNVKVKLPSLGAAKLIVGLFKEECTVESIYELLFPSVNTEELEYLYQLYELSVHERSSSVTPQNCNRYVVIPALLLGMLRISLVYGRAIIAYEETNGLQVSPNSVLSGDLSQARSVKKISSELSSVLNELCNSGQIKSTSNLKSQELDILSSRASLSTFSLDYLLEPNFTEITLKQKAV